MNYCACTDGNTCVTRALTFANSSTAVSQLFRCSVTGLLGVFTSATLRSASGVRSSASSKRVLRKRMLVLSGA